MAEARAAAPGGAVTDELRWPDATDHAALVHSGAATARELTEAFNRVEPRA